MRTILVDRFLMSMIISDECSQHWKKGLFSQGNIQLTAESKLFICLANFSCP